MDRKIVKATISPLPTEIGDPMPVVSVEFDDGTTKKLFSYYPDEVSFTEAEFIGLTERQAVGLKGRKDLAFLRS
ncbi:hypothetical protein [Ralstonia pseudosolanacearum]|uniref:hypothetical protein n=1 Tax=Ralstonia pseudosolanacearum TaxID=1310165 RepID=UPI003CF44728